MSLLTTWREMAYEQEMTPQNEQLFWGNYFNLEKDIYKKILQNPKDVVKGTVKELSEKFGVELMIMVGFLDGINESLKAANPIETLEETTEVNLEYDAETLYKKMVEAKAEWLYTLPEWDTLIDADRRKELYKEQRLSTTVVNTEKKVGRNDPCPCGSGLKYKKCCGKNA